MQREGKPNYWWKAFLTYTLLVNIELRSMEAIQKLYLIKVMKKYNSS